MVEKVTADDSDECSSYGSEDSGEWEMETSKLEVEKTMGEAMQAMKASLASICSVQATVSEKLASLERMVLSVQYDMTRVRNDLKIRHNVIDNIADQVSELRDATAEAERLREHVAVDVGACGTWKANGNVEAHDKSSDILSERDKDVVLPDFDPSYDPPCYQPGSYIEDTPQFEMLAEMNTSTMMTPEEEGPQKGGNGRGALARLCSPPCPQTLGSMDVDELQEESQSVEMTCPSTQLRTPGPLRCMWNDFTDVVRDWPAPTSDGSGRGEGWVSAKRGRGTSPEYGQEKANGGKKSGLISHASLNLNVSPDQHLAEVTMPRRGDDDGNKFHASTTGHGSRGGGRGTARAKRPAAVEPRYHSSVRAYLNP